MTHKKDIKLLMTDEKILDKPQQQKGETANYPRDAEAADKELLEKIEQRKNIKQEYSNTKIQAIAMVTVAIILLIFALSRTSTLSAFISTLTTAAIAGMLVSGIILFQMVKVTKNRAINAPINKTTRQENHKEDSAESYIKQKEQMKKNIQKGKDYEAFVGSYYETLGYDVKAFGFERGRSDNGIDIVATKNGEALFIQCKNWSKNSQYKINHEKIKSFVGSVSMFKIKYPEYKDIKETLLYIASEDIFDNSAKKYCQECKEYVRYKILPMDKMKKYTTARLAILHEMTTKEMESLLIKNGYLEQKEKGLYLASKGKQVGEWRAGEGKGYFLWDNDINLTA
ncbi:MAG: restriction endonuclease [Campylobacteraceae bacterium]|jgi:restriction system protein|nr:restriction endonuclease [Campylobacteraceae bacterium]